MFTFLGFRFRLRKKLTTLFRERPSLVQSSILTFTVGLLLLSKLLNNSFSWNVVKAWLGLRFRKRTESSLSNEERPIELNVWIYCRTGTHAHTNGQMDEGLSLLVVKAGALGATRGNSVPSARQTPGARQGTRMGTAYAKTLVWAPKSHMDFSGHPQSKPVPHYNQVLTRLSATPAHTPHKS